jgi:uncharacterized membrane-anchored protein YjiN (DUF445 family)
VPTTSSDAQRTPPLDDAARQARLDKMRARATGLLIVAAVVFLVTHHFAPTYPILDWARAASDAALVGGLADWFAVTALFRRPLGLPIPHTAIVVTQQERIGRVLGNFVQRHFLTPEVVTQELRRLRPSERVAWWLSKPENSARVAAQLSTGFVRAIQAVPDDELRGVIRRAATERLEKTRIAPILGDLLAAMTTDDRHHGLLDEALRVVVTALQENRNTIREHIAKDRPWYLPRVVESAIYAQAVRSAETLLVAVKTHPDHPLRRKFDDALEAFTDRLRHSPEVSAQADLIKRKVLSPAVVEDLVDGVWDSVRASALRREAGGEPPPESIAHAIRAAGAALLANETLLAELDEVLINSASAVVERHRDQIGELIARTIRSWNPQVAATRLELAVGSDLQYIRINGTLVGALAGLAIHAIAKLLP